ncbi:MAG TPA: poly-gamma-glutamate biosynthesis protein [Deltaproteobacteria bacterium]|nr:poly-gamma-glutamate biosynthesis protein [Deltaproteobacteria bacterium]
MRLPRKPALVLFLCGDVMTGRGVDQILAHPSEPQLYEPAVHSAMGYVQLAEMRTGPIPRPVGPAYVWGDALDVLEHAKPDVRIVNLETAVTLSDEASEGKDVHYRMHPRNVDCLIAARIDCCVLANNHVLDWGQRGLAETLETLHGAGIRTAGAGRDDREADEAAVLELGGRSRVLVFAFGLETSGIPREWAAGKGRFGVNWLADLSLRSVRQVADRVRAVKRPGDLVVVSLHWGENWGFVIPKSQRAFARELVDTAGVDVVYGHSSHHVKAVEVHHERPIFYGCGDFLNDYEGIGGYEAYHPDLGLMYFPAFDQASGRLVRLAMTPTQIRHFRVNRAPEEGVRWLLETMRREAGALGVRVEPASDDSFGAGGSGVLQGVWRPAITAAT